MYCPSCKCEFREGFTRCDGCGVDLVDGLESTGAGASTAAAAPEAALPVRLADYCGFFALDDARQGRDQLRSEGIANEIAIRRPLDSDEEEFWLRVDAARYRQAAAILGYDAADGSSKEGSFSCDSCGQSVSENETFCANCGARFDE